MQAFSKVYWANLWDIYVQCTTTKAGCCNVDTNIQFSTSLAKTLEVQVCFPFKYYDGKYFLIAQLQKISIPHTSPTEGGGDANQTTFCGREGGGREGVIDIFCPEAHIQLACCFVVLHFDTVEWSWLPSKWLKSSPFLQQNISVFSTLPQVHFLSNCVFEVAVHMPFWLDQSRNVKMDVMLCYSALTLWVCKFSSQTFITVLYFVDPNHFSLTHKLTKKLK